MSVGYQHRTEAKRFEDERKDRRWEIIFNSLLKLGFSRADAGIAATLGVFGTATVVGVALLASLKD